MLARVIGTSRARQQFRLFPAADFCDFTFANVVRLFGRQKPHFFAGTRVSAAAEAVLREAAPPRIAAQ
jgi:hypothetical protein